jgi:hypothetical protein
VEVTCGTLHIGVGGGAAGGSAVFGPFPVAVIAAATPKAAPSGYGSCHVETNNKKLWEETSLIPRLWHPPPRFHVPVRPGFATGGGGVILDLDPEYHW